MTKASIFLRKQNILSWIENLNDQKVLKILEDLKDSQNHLLPGKSMSVNEFKERVLRAHEAVLNGDFITHDDLKREMETW